MPKATTKNIRHRGKGYVQVGKSTFTIKEVVKANDRYKKIKKQQKADKKKKRKKKHK